MASKADQADLNEFIKGGAGAKASSEVHKNEGLYRRQTFESNNTTGPRSCAGVSKSQAFVKPLNDISSKCCNLYYKHHDQYQHLRSHFHTLLIDSLSQLESTSEILEHECGKLRLW